MSSSLFEQTGMFYRLGGWGGGSRMNITHDALDLPYRDHAPRHGTSLYGDLLRPPPPQAMLKLVHYKACTEGKRVVGILLECFIVFIY